MKRTALLVLVLALTACEGFPCDSDTDCLSSSLVCRHQKCSQRTNFERKAKAVKDGIAGIIHDLSK